MADQSAVFLLLTSGFLTAVWSKAPSMRVKRSYPTANVFDGNIYVAGGCKEYNSSDWMEVFDPKTQTWEPVLSPRFTSSVNKRAVINGRISYMFGTNGVAYKPKEDRWETVEMSTLVLGWNFFSYYVIDNVLYCDSGRDGLVWYDFKRPYWWELKGLEGLPKFDDFCFFSSGGLWWEVACFHDPVFTFEWL